MKKILALFLTVMMCVGLFGNNVYAEPGNETALNAENHTYYVDNAAGNLLMGEQTALHMTLRLKSVKFMM